MRSFKPVATVLIFCMIFTGICGFADYFDVEDGDFYYDIIGVHMTWAAANAYCEARSATLTSLMSYREMYWLGSFIDNEIGNEDEHWIGLRIDEPCDCSTVDAPNDECNDNPDSACCQCLPNWMWTDDSEFTYARWESNYPKGDNGMICGKLSKESFLWKFRSGLCDEEIKFVCKRYINLPTTTTTAAPTAAPTTEATEAATEAAAEAATEAAEVAVTTAAAAGNATEAGETGGQSTAAPGSGDTDNPEPDPTTDNGVTLGARVAVVVLLALVPAIIY